jgi:microcystin degradation protein MlrC
MHDGLFALMQRRIRQMVEGDERILAISLLPVQPQMDLPNLGFSALVVTDGEPALGQAVAQQLVDEAWEQRHEFDVEFIAPARAIQMALDAPGQPVVLSDLADGVGGGSAGDGTHVLRAMLDANLTVPTMLTCIDPEAVQEAIAAGFGATVTVSVGGKRDPAFNTPVVVTGRVKTISDASYRAYGMPVEMGPCVVLEIGAIELLLISNTVHVINPWVYRAVGLEPTQAKIVLVKSPAQFREEFEPIAAEIILVDAPGACSSNFKTLPYRRITRPLYPWDETREPTG